MRTLYVSDLDGTLLDSSKSVSNFSAAVINQGVKNGMRFTIATARMPYGCDTRLSAINLSLPAIATNGVFLYDFMRNTFVSVEPIGEDDALLAIDVFKRHGVPCFLYTYDVLGIGLYFDLPGLVKQTQYYSERAKVACREVKMVEDCRLEISSARQAVYLAATGDEQNLLPIRDILKEAPGLSIAYYLNIYNGQYCLEVASAKATKRNALEKLAAYVDYDELVVFGDNLNDLPMIPGRTHQISSILCSTSVFIAAKFLRFLIPTFKYFACDR